MQHARDGGFILRLSVRATSIRGLRALERAVSRLSGCMGHARDATREAMAPAFPQTNTSPVAGTIRSAPSPLSEAIDAWAEDMSRRRCRPRSIRSFRSVVEEGARECGWSRVEDIKYEPVTTWIKAQMDSGRWAGNTADRNLSAFRSFTHFLAAVDRIPKDPLARAVGTGDEDQSGARAATVEEARRFLECTSMACMKDGRNPGNRPGYWTGMFLGGLRIGELGGDEADDVPRGWRWGDLHLDDSIPSVVWKADMHKAAAKIQLPLHPTFAAILRSQKDRVPSGPADPVFPIRPARTSWRTDRIAAGIEEVDAMGRRFSPHSARKSFRTWLAVAGVNDTIINILMRHFSLASKYTLPSLSALSEALYALPDLTTQKNPGGCNQNNLDSRRQIDDTESATHDHSHKHHGPSDDRAPHGHESHQKPADARSSDRPCGSRLVSGEPALSSTQSLPKMPTLGSETQVDAIAGWLEATARLLRGVAHVCTGP